MEFRLIILIIVVNTLTTESIGLKIGLIYDELYPNVEKVFQKAIEDVNAENPELEMEGVTVITKLGNSFDISKKICDILPESVVAVFAATTSSVSEHAFGICDAKEMPFIETRWSSELELPGLNLHPHISQLAVAIKDLILKLEWGSFTILYETGDYLSLVNEVLQLYGPEGPTITVRRFDLDLDGNYRNVLRRVKISEQKEILVVGSTENLPEFLKQAQQIGILTDAYHYVIGDLDFQNIDLEPFQYSETNISGYRLILSESEEVKNLQKILCNGDADTFNYTCSVTVNQGLVYDGIKMLAKTLMNGKVVPLPLSCDSDDSWKDGLTLINDYTSTTMDGTSGLIEFDEENFRTNFKLEAIELTTAGIITFGTWSSNYDEDDKGSKLVINRKTAENKVEDTRSLADKTFTIVIANSEPYCMWKETSQRLYGNDRFEGIGIELFEELSKKLGFKYNFVMQADGKYGSKDAITGKWNGMILEILEERADLGITDLTMTSERESGVDFTIPFMNLGIAILFRKPQKEPPELFSFMSPFSREVWGFLGVAYISVSISLFVLGRISADEWDNPYPCIQEPTKLENQFSFANSMWFTVGALLQQGSEIAPKAASTRTVASMWWFFTLILVSSYTANLAAFLTVESLISPIDNVEDLSNNKGGTTYGAKAGGSTFKFFEDATFPTYKRMFEYMKSHPEHMPDSNPEGVRRAQDESLNYAFLMESTSLEYEIERKCTLTQVGKLLDEKGYGIAMRKNWPFRDALSKAILELQEGGALTKMKNKWWKEKRGGGACNVAGGDGGDATALEMENLGGVFLVLIVGSFSAVFISSLELLNELRSKAKEKGTKDSDTDAQPLGMPNLLGVYAVLMFGSIMGLIFGFFEWICFLFQTSRKHQIPFKDIFMEEFKFVMKCSGNTKTLKSSSESSSSKSSLSLDSIDTHHNSLNDKTKNEGNIFSKLSKLSLNTLHKIKN